MSLSCSPPPERPRNRVASEPWIGQPSGSAIEPAPGGSEVQLDCLAPVALIAPFMTAGASFDSDGIDPDRARGVTHAADASSETIATAAGALMSKSRRAPCSRLLGQARVEEDDRVGGARIMVPAGDVHARRRGI